VTNRFVDQPVPGPYSYDLYLAMSQGYGTYDVQNSTLKETKDQDLRSTYVRDAAFFSYCTLSIGAEHFWLCVRRDYFTYVP
jgi:hypothetical protein